MGGRQVGGRQGGRQEGGRETGGGGGGGGGRQGGDRGGLDCAFYSRKVSIYALSAKNQHKLLGGGGSAPKIPLCFLHLCKGLV